MGQRFLLMIVFSTGSVLCLACLCLVNFRLCAHTSSFPECTHFLVVTAGRIDITRLLLSSWFSLLVHSGIQQHPFVFPVNLHISDVCMTHFVTLDSCFVFLFIPLSFSCDDKGPLRQLLPFFSLHLPFVQLCKPHCFNFMQDVVWCFG